MKLRLRFAIGLIIVSAINLAGVLGIRAVSAQPVPPPSACHPVTAPKHTYRALGQHAAMVCTNATGTTAYAVGLSCRHDQCNLEAFGAAMLRVTTAPDYRRALDAEWAAHIKWSCDAPPDVAATALCAERAKWIGDHWAQWTASFKPAVWKVKPNGATLTRPAHTLAAGVLGTKEAGRAAVGAVCDLTKPTAPATGSDLRAQWQGGPTGVVTICTRATP